jgi:predicted PurR-regulated permease PerM
MINQNWWFTTLLVKQFKYCPPLNKSIKCDVLIVGGGFSGVSAAAEFLLKGLSVVLIDRNIVGGSSAGRSAGFLTPDSELELHQLARRYGNEAAREIWEMPCRGIDRVVQAIRKNGIECGLLEQDSLFLGIGKSGKEAVESEFESRQSLGFTDQQIYDENGLKAVIGAEKFTAAIRYSGTYGINPLLCLQGFKDLFINHGMQVFESTEMERLDDHTIYTHGGSITADRVIIAVDKLGTAISPLAEEIFHAQTFMSVSAPLTDRELGLLFPSGKQMQCWDSKMVYSYFRLTGDNRLLLPIVGKPLTDLWRLASTNLSAALQSLAPQLKAGASGLLAVAAAAGLSALQFFVAILVAGFFLANFSRCAGVSRRLAVHFFGNKGEEFEALAGATIRSVTTGILGVALIQSLLAGLGFLVIRLPGAGLWTAVFLIAAVLQVGGLVLIPIVIYVFATVGTAKAVIFLIWCILVALTDNVLKPLLLGRGVPVPIVVVFLGAIGGFLAVGIIGLFIGPIVLSVGYKLFLAWLNQGVDPLPAIVRGDISQDRPVADLGD